MTTIIFDIDGTLTNMWPIERCVLMHMLGEKKKVAMDNLHTAGIRDTYKIYRHVSRVQINKTNYYAQYNKTFTFLMQNKKLPRPISYPLVRWIKKYSGKYHFVYVTGGQQIETQYVLQRLGILSVFDELYSLDRVNYPFSKSTGLPFRRLRSVFADAVVVGDSLSDKIGAKLADLPFIQVFPEQQNIRLP